MNKAAKNGFALLASGIGLVASAHAQGSVTLYGMLDAGIMYTSKTPGANGRNAGATVSFVNSSYLPSKWGIEGHEDLGGGYKANFKLESGISLANGGFDNNLAGSFFGRQSWVGVSGPLGEVRAGVQFSPFEEAMFELDPRGFQQIGTLVTLYSANNISGTFSPNAFEYRSPEIHGLKGVVMTCLGGHAGDFRQGFCYSGMLTYEIGGLKIVAGALDQVEASGTEESNPNFIFTQPVIAKTIGASYGFDKVRVYANYTTFRGDLLANASGKNDVYNVGAAWEITPFVTTNGTISWILDPDHSNSHTFQASGSVSYDLSKRTSVYGEVAVVSNHGDEHIGPTMENGNLVGVSGTTVAASAGIRHSF
ncbi:porin [Paraburkholderia sp.]|uniref:porin n=1 Tax=Paraburkholderia sp. TaxID=1926495 RepID=UPI0025FB1BF2|nr:porin [Paraburkholderia sp.]